MSGIVTSYVGLFCPRDDEALTIERIEIPLIQRDYAQGRADADVADIRSDFLDVLLAAAAGETRVGLDFVYGDVRDGTLRPLDGQQRLTTLFLLHWYIAFRTERLEAGLDWTRFSYATRASARLFCERLTENPPPATVTNPSAWIKDQSWYLHVWRHDPTIRSMLVMIDAIDSRFHDIDLPMAWVRLTDEAEPAISFHLLPIEEMGAGDELYIKMNSRGKPLTPFENFKARFEKALEGSPRAAEFAERIDGAWSDVFWAYRGTDDIVDDELIRYFAFVTQVTEWQNGTIARGRLEPRAEAVFSPDTANGPANLDFLFDAFDAWRDIDVASLFAGLLTNDISRRSEKVLLFGARQIDHFRACCDSYTFGGSRPFGWAETLTLYAVLIHRIHRTEGFPRRLRILRNLLEASSNELRLENMPALVREVAALVRGSSHEQALANLSAFNEAQIDDERAKAAFLAVHPDLTDIVFDLEDHRLLRGSLVGIELDADRLPARAALFRKIMADQSLWPALTGALLATGDYSRRRNPRSFRFGSPEDDRWWRELLTGTRRANLSRTAKVLAELLDAVAGATTDLPGALRTIRNDWLAEQDTFDWRYYLVKYDAMRAGKSGIYFAEGGHMSFRLCMLDKTQLNSWYRDPFLLAVWEEVDCPGAVEDPWFMGYETAARWMTLYKSRTAIRCVTQGFQLMPPPTEADLLAFTAVCHAWGIGDDNLLRLPQHQRDGRLFDDEDRVQKGVQLLKDLIAAGL
ncbi:DUF262 domain-containing protein [Actinoplanes teichomyceticus]|uniref:Uncharacterized protein DUF262 n=1 Tax=Actinoplanes teichomyceticus TaxID=1867 RepID=A0A561VGJ3_ACTTI|nr:DUF262 domain-containing protein [Actinoplanes teichomyceticus]TWG10727.1 uncharacterized protein DUF262 [Actinoplanes teichomyceticus]GIF12651.1 hypothetical protein Ate01nite_26830 [Actinoplanes teichomyceticus]